MDEEGGAMSIESDLFAFLVTSVPGVAGRVYPPPMPQGGTLPAMTYERIAAPRSLTHSGPCEYVPASYQVDLYSRTRLEARALAEVLRGALNGYRGPMGPGTSKVYVARLDSDLDLYEPDTRLHRVAQTYALHYQEEV